MCSLNSYAGVVNTTGHSSAEVKYPPLNAVAAMDLESISATEAIWPPAGLEPSRFGKFLVLWRIQKSLLPGASEAPKHGPQNAVFTRTP